MAKERSCRGLFGQPLDERGDPETVRVVKLALRLARRCMRDYTHAKSPKKFTQPQLMACLIFKAFLGLTYRRTEELLTLMPAVRDAIGLTSVPRFTTLQTFADDPRTLEVVDAILKQIGRAINKAEPQDASIDATGLEVTSASAHFLSRAGRKRTKFVKLSIAVLCGAMIPCGLVVDWGPSHDMKQAWALLDKVRATTTPLLMWGDKAFDSEELHEWCWNDWGVPSIAPAVVRRADGTVTGLHRAMFITPPRQYGRRWASETVNSAFKRVCGGVLRSRKVGTLFAEAALKVAAYAVVR
jgi:hypothetical protein